MTPDALSVTFAALADPTRRGILARLAAGSATVKELAAPFTMSGPAISKHLRVLERAGLITRGRDAQWRPCHLETAPIKDVVEWAEEFRRFWDERYDRLDGYLESLQTPSQQTEATTSPTPPRIPSTGDDHEQHGNPHRSDDVLDPVRPGDPDGSHRASPA